VLFRLFRNRLRAVIIYMEYRQYNLPPPFHNIIAKSIPKTIAPKNHKYLPCEKPGLLQ
jgi:hypothetical protein